eukprot:gnl/MRDRNA2_/MRDRNA2_82076_c0_seq1.p1 gnl/MRDRNA2_/MRDRNA2_82076_c0~~gnl/MRDRNA2_/MRDRNA2_82076_c0_seq1.p1  ORF type:complete len:1863 (-),score=378.80 gnl/MRDRNA2_/MRDRNA2_82076_c0_seq1:156-5372(-)
MDHADVKKHKLECNALHQQARRLAFQEEIHTRRLEAGRRLATTVPVELKPPLIDATCELNDCVSVDTEDKCNKFSVDLGMNFPGGATKVANGQERSTAPFGCFIKTIRAYSGLETHLMWNDNKEATGTAGNNDAGGEYRPLCECNQGKYPLPVLTEGIEAEDASNFGCSSEGEAMPWLGDGELLLDDLLNNTVRCSYTGECKGDEVNGLSDSLFDEKCGTPTDATSESTMGDPGNWGGIIWSSKAELKKGSTACYKVTASGDKLKNMGVTGTYKFIVHDYKNSGIFEFVSSTLKAKKVPLADFGKLTALQGRIMGRTSPTPAPLNFIGYDKAPTFIWSANTDINPLFDGILKGFKLPLVPGNSQVKGDWSFDINDGLKFENAFVNVGWNVGPGKLWPDIFTVAPTLFVTLGTMKGSYEDAVLGKTESTGARTVQWGIIRLPHGCGALKINELSANGNFKFTLGVPSGYVLKEDFEIAKNDIARMPVTLMGQTVLKISKKTLGTESDFEIELRIKYEDESGQMELGGMTNTPVIWKIEPLGTKAEFHARAQYLGPVKDFNQKKLKLRFKGCGFGDAPFKIGAAPPPQLFVTGDFEGTYEQGSVEYEVAAGVENMAIDDVLKEANVKFTYSKSSGLQIEGAAKVELDLKGVTQKPSMAVVLKYTPEDGLRVKGTSSVMIAPAAWGLPSATVDFSYESKRTPKIVASAEITGTIKVEALFPGAPTGIQVTVFASSQKEFYVQGVTQITLPASLGSKKVDITVKVDKDAGLTAVGETKGLDYKLIDFGSSLNQKGLPDVTIKDVVVMASSPWGKKKEPVVPCKDDDNSGYGSCKDWVEGERRRRYYSSRRRRRRRRRGYSENYCVGEGRRRQRRRWWIDKIQSVCKNSCGKCPKKEAKASGPKAAIWIQAQMGGKDSLAEGLAVFTGSGICLVLQASPDAIEPVLRSVGLSSDKLEKQTIALCNDPTVLDDLQLPEVAAIDQADVEAPPPSHRRRRRGQRDVTKTSKSPKEFGKTMPKVSIKGFSITLPIQIAKGSAVANLLSFAQIPLRKFEFSIGYDFKAKEGVMKVTFGKMTWKNKGALEEANFDLAFEVVIGKKMSLPQVSAALDLKIRVDQESGKLLSFKGEVAASSSAVVGSIELYSPSVLRLLSKRIGLISRKSKPIKLAVGWSQISGMTMEAQANVILSSDKDVPVAVFTPTAGDSYWDACMLNGACTAVDFILALSYDPRAQKVSIDRLQVRMAGALNYVTLLQSVLGCDLPSAMSGAVGKWLGTINLFSLDYNPAALNVHAAGAVSAANVGMMFAFGVGLNSGGFNIDLRMAVSQGCLGVGTLNSCTGIVLESVGQPAYNEWDGIVKKIKSYGWPKPEDKWSTNLLPSQLRSKYNMGSYAKFVLTHKGLSLDINVKGRMSVSFIDLKSVLPSVSMRVQYNSGYLKVDVKVGFGSFIKMNVGFGLFMGSASHSNGKLIVKPPSFGYFKFAIDCSAEGGSLMTNLRNHAKKTWGWFWFWFADSVLRIFSWIDFKWFKFEFSTRRAALDLNFRFLGITIHIKLNFDFAKAKKALGGSYGDVASSSSNAMEKHEVDACDVDKDKGSRGHAKDYTYTYSTWWAWGYRYGHDSKCGKYYKRHRHCGYNAWHCGVNKGWWYVRARHCCWSSTSSHYHGCYYKYKKWGRHSELKHFRYKVTYGKCAAWYKSGHRLKYLTSTHSYKNYIMQSEYYCGNRWPSRWHGGGCDHNCNCGYRRRR